MLFALALLLILCGLVLLAWSWHIAPFRPLGRKRKDPS